MRYINPIDLLNFKSENLEDINSLAIRKAKKSLLADIELSDNATVNHNGMLLTKSDCLKAIDDLDNRDKMEFHYFIYCNSALKSFLSNGDLSFFRTYKSESIYKLTDFLDFVSPFFAFQYDRQLMKSVKNGSNFEVKLILSVKPIVSNSYIELCYRGTYLALKEIEDEIIQLNKDITNAAKGQLGSGNEDLPFEIAKKVDSGLLNLLPSYFQGNKNSIAQAVGNLARDINNDPYKNYEVAFKIIEIAYDVPSDGLTRQTISKWFFTIKKNYVDGVSKDTESTGRKAEIVVEEKSSDIEDTTTKHRAFYFAFVSAAFAIGFFCSPVQKILIGLALLNLAFPLMFVLKNREFSFLTFIKRKGIFVLSAGLGWFYPFFAQLYLSYFFFVYFVGFYEDVTGSGKKERKSFSFFTYGFCALLITVLSYTYWNTSGSTVNNSVDDSKNNSEELNAIPRVPDQVKTVPPVVKLTRPELYSFPYVKSGNIVGCTKIKPKYAKRIDNQLVISCGSNASVAVKMINEKTGKSIRYVYIHKNSVYSIKNIPQGRYYLKIAYGNNWGVKTGETLCDGRFTSNALYKKSDEILDFNLIPSADGGYQIPSFQLKLDVVIIEDKMSAFSTNSINESDFYNE